MKNILILFLVSTFIFTACDNNNGAAKNAESAATGDEVMEQKAWDAMMVVHDEVMPKMSDINRTNNELQEWAVANKEKMANGDLERIAVSLKDLNAADDGMMNWMNALQQLDGLRAEKNHQEIMNYLQEQTKIITKVKTDMLSSIENGQALLTELKAG